MATLFSPFFQQVDGNGDPLAGGKLYFYQTGTTTLQDTYTTSALTTANSNPMVADADGRWGPIYLGTTADYKVVLKDVSDVTIATLDPLFAAGVSGRAVVNDANYIVSISDRLIAYTAISNARTVTLPAAANFPAGTMLTIIDESGSASSTNVISAAPNGTDTINGMNFSVPMVGTGYGSASLESDGATKWIISRRTLDGFTTLDWKLTLKTTADAGWLMLDDTSIGDSSSGATHTGDQYRPLYLALYAAVSDTYAPVSTGRGASSSADWAAHKTISLTKVLGRALAVAGAGSGLTSRALGLTVGAETHTHTLSGNSGVASASVGRGDTGASTSVATSTHTHDLSSGAADAGSSMQPSAFLNVMIKL